MLPPAPDPAEVAALLPPGFVLGAATAALQIEGAAREGGRTDSTWDVFARRPGVILDGSTPEITADHAHRMAEDVALSRDLGVDGYRFSISWPRIQPDGRGPANPAGVALYDRLLDGLLEAGIRPMATLFHWDTPQPLEERGGWLRRDTAERFAEYAALAGEAFGDRVADWVTINEPTTVILDGYALGIHAPGRARVFRALPAAANLLRGHGLAVRALRDVPVRGRIGIVNVHSPVEPASDSRDDRRMAALLDHVHNRVVADPVLLGRAPAPPRDLPLPFRAALRLLGRIRRADLEAISEPLDFYGLNYYFPSRVAAGGGDDVSSPDGQAEAMRDVPFHLVAQPEHPETGFGWPVVPDGLRRSLAELRDRYGERLPPIVITENGASYPDPDAVGGAVADPERTAAIAAHLAVAARGVPGVEVEGFYVWSLLDNWEWAAGFTQAFGIVHVDFATGERTPKDSYRWLRALQGARRR